MLAKGLVKRRVFEQLQPSRQLKYIPALAIGDNKITSVWQKGARRISGYFASSHVQAEEQAATPATFNVRYQSICAIKSNNNREADSGHLTEHLVHLHPLLSVVKKRKRRRWRINYETFENFPISHFS